MTDFLIPHLKNEFPLALDKNWELLLRSVG